MEGTSLPQETEIPSPSALLAALSFAADRHRNQHRKDNPTPFINHPIAVAELLARVGRVTDVTTLQAALLHDVLEDTLTTAEELGKHFGPAVLALVQEVTDDKSLPSPQRKQRQIEHAPHLSPRAKQIKIADKISNIIDITTQPVDWPLRRKREYLDWAEKVVAGCRGSNAPLEEHFDQILKTQRELLDRGD